MERSADYVILGAGIAGMTMQHVLGNGRAVLLDAAPGKYKIGESIIPQHFVEPEVRPLLDIVTRLPCSTPKEGSLFVDDTSVGGFEIFADAPFAVHLPRQDLEAATAAFFGSEITRARVSAVDVGARTVTTDQGVFHANQLIIDCSGPARIVARALGILREVWPVWASWAYHDVTATHDEAFHDMLRRGDKQYYRFDNKTRRVERSHEYGTFHPSYCTVLTRVRDGVWTWQIPLHRATMLSVGVVSRHGPVSPEEYTETVSATIAPQFETRPRPWDEAGDFNRFHVRNRFAWAADRFAGEGFALVGDAAFFGDPVYSVGTGFATNHAIQLGRILREMGWGPKVAAAHQRHTAHLYARAKSAYDNWYFGEVVHDGQASAEIQRDFLNGHAFQVATLASYRDLWLVSHPQEADNEMGAATGEVVTERVLALLGEAPHLAGWGLARARAFKQRIEIEWQRPDAAPFSARVEVLMPGQRPYRTIGALGLSYSRPKGETGRLDGQRLALLEALAQVVEREQDGLAAIMSDAVY